MKNTKERTHRWRIAAAVIIGLLVVIRLAAPPLILNRLNKTLAEFSPVYSIHIADLDLSIIRGAYRFENLTAKMKSNQREFLKIEAVDVSVAWRELFRGRILTDIVTEGANFILSKALIESAGQVKQPEKNAKDVAETLFPVRVERIEIKDSGFVFAELLGDPESKLWRISSIEGAVSNFTATEKSPFTRYVLNGTVLDSAKFKAVGSLKRLEDPMQWEVDAEVREFDLVAANPMLKSLVPVTFTSGHLDAFAEARSVNGKIDGYFKPFFKKLDVVAPKENFVGLKHFAVEILSALGNLIFRKSEDKSTAARIPFSSGPGGLKVDTGRILPTAIQHGFNGGLQPDIEDQINLER